MGAPPSRSRRRALGQNFINSKALASQIVRETAISRADTVVEIGAGAGALTTELVRRAGRVIAIEVDPVWGRRLADRFADFPNLEVVVADALAVPLPSTPYRVAGNLPFHLAAPLLRRLLDDGGRAFERADVIVEWHMALKRSGYPPTMQNISWAPWYRFTLGRRIPASAFSPAPRVDAGVLSIVRRPVPLLPPRDQRAFARFVACSYRSLPQLGAGEWIRRFSQTRDGGRAAQPRRRR